MGRAGNWEKQAWMRAMGMMEVVSGAMPAHIVMLAILARVMV